MFLPRLFSFLAILFLFAAPIVSFAVTTPTTFKELVSLVLTDIITPVVALIVGLALAAFLWGVAQYVIKSDDVKAQEAAKSKMVYGIIALAVMLSVWGLVEILTATFGITGLSIPQLQSR